MIEKEAEPDSLWVQFEAMMDDQVQESESPLDSFIPQSGRANHPESISPLPRVFPSGLEYARTALRWFAEKGEKLDGGVEGETVYLTAPGDLRQRLNYLPREVRPEHDHFTLTTNKESIHAEIRRTRQEEDAAWPQLHYLWPLHPVMEWLSDRALNAFGRHTAPVLRLTGRLAGDEHIILTHGGFPNRRGHVLVQQWTAVRIQGGEVVETMNWETLQDRLDLRPGTLPNPGRTGSTAPLRALLPRAIAASRDKLRALKRAFDAERRPILEQHRQRLAELKRQHEGQLRLELERSGQPEAVKARREQERQTHIDRIFRDYQDWLENTQSTEAEPYLQIAAVFTGTPASQ